MHRAGFVNIVGNPNVGKSTLSNRLVGERLSIITSKAQTTRHRIMGIVNGEDYQIVFSDTPGVLKPKFKLQQSMLEYSTGALVDADVLLYVTDVIESPTKNQDFLDRVAREKIPILLVINKIDLLKGNDDLMRIIDQWKQLLPNAEVFPTSALENFNVDNIMARIVELLPESPPYFGKDALTDRSSRFFVTEIVREKIRATPPSTSWPSSMSSAIPRRASSSATRAKSSSTWASRPARTSRSSSTRRSISNCMLR